MVDGNPSWSLHAQTSFPNTMHAQTYNGKIVIKQNSSFYTGLKDAWCTPASILKHMHISPGKPRRVVHIQANTHTHDRKIAQETHTCMQTL